MHVPMGLDYSNVLCDTAVRTGFFECGFFIHALYLFFSVEALNNISARYAVGFGGFGEKRAAPFALPGDDERTYKRQLFNLNVYVAKIILSYIA